MPTLKFIDGRLAPCGAERATEITLAEWREGARPEGGRFALVLPNDAELAEVAGGLAAFDVVILNFPSFRDGRAFSQARLLRDRFGYRGEIRARGDVLRDQAFFMRRTGFDAFEIDCVDAADFTEALETFSFSYQRACDNAAPVFSLRAERAAAA